MKTKRTASQGKIKIYFLAIAISCLGLASSTFAQDTTPPTVIKQINDQSINEDQHFRLELNLNEVFSDESPMTFSIDKKDAEWLANVGDSILVGFPLEEHVGNYEIDVKATDSSGNYSTTSFNITVVHVDDKPLVIKNLPGQLQRPGFGEIKVSYKGTFYEEEDESLTYDVHSSYPAVATAQLIGDSILITEKGIGPAEIILTATDSNGNKTEAKMFIRVYEEAEILNMTTANTGSNSLADSWVSCVSNDSSGNVWAGHIDGISRYKNGKWEQFRLDDYSTDVLEIWDDGKGTIFFITRESIVTYNNQEFTFSHSVGGNDKFLNIIGSCISNDNSLYIAGWTHDKFIISKTKGDKWETVYIVDRSNDTRPFDNLYEMCVDNNSNIWLADYYNLFVIENGICTNFSAENNITESIYVGVDLDIYGNIWFIGESKIYKHNPKGNTLDSFTSNGLKRSILADNLGNIWVGTEIGQVVRIRDDKVDRIELKNPIISGYTNPYNSVDNIFKTNDGRYWFCSQKGLYISENFLLKDESTIIQHTFDGLPSNEIYDIQRDQNGIYWFNTLAGLSNFDGIKWDYHGLMLRVRSIDNNDRKLCTYGYDHASFTIIDQDYNKTDYGKELTGFERVYDIKCDENNNIWLSGKGESGLVKFDGTNWIKYGTDDGLLYNSTYKLFADSKGNIWMNYILESINSISKFDGSTFTHFYESDGIGKHIATAFAEDLNGNIWIASFNGLFKFDGENWTNYNRYNGLKSDFIRSLTLDYLGGIWICYSSVKHNFGVCRFDGTKFEHFTTEDGLPTNNIRNVYVEHALTNQNKSSSLNEDDAKELIWLGTGDKGAANFYLQNATSVVDRSLPEMEAMIFPNPTQGITNILLDNRNRKYLDIEVLTMDGTKVYQNNTSNLQSKVQVNLSAQPAGTYFIKLKSDIDSVVKKIIKN